MYERTFQLHYVAFSGVSESILSAALSRIGKRVLHLDKKEFYGGLWSTFNFSDFNRWLEEMKTYVNINFFHCFSSHIILLGL